MADEKSSIKHRVVKRRLFGRKSRLALKFGLILTIVAIALYMLSDDSQKHTQEDNKIQQQWDYLFVVEEPQVDSEHLLEIERLRAENAQLVELQNSLKLQIDSLMNLQHKLSGELTQQEKFHNIEKNRRIALQEKLKESEQKITSLNEKIHILEKAQKQEASKSYYNTDEVEKGCNKNKRRVDNVREPEEPKYHQDAVETPEYAEVKLLKQQAEEISCWKSLQKCMGACQSDIFLPWNCYSNCLSSLNLGSCLSLLQGKYGWLSM